MITFFRTVFQKKKRAFTLYVHSLLCLLTCLTVSIQAAPKQDTTALRAVSKMLNSLNHVKTLELEGEMVKIDKGQQATMNYRLYAKGDTHITVEVYAPVKAVYIKNPKGFFVVQKGDIQRTADGVLPVDVPTSFFKGMTVGDVTDNYKFVVQRQSSADIVVDMVPVGTGGSVLRTSMMPMP